MRFGKNIREKYGAFWEKAICTIYLSLEIVTNHALIMAQGLRDRGNGCFFSTELLHRMISPCRHHLHLFLLSETSHTPTQRYERQPLGYYHQLEAKRNIRRVSGLGSKYVNLKGIKAGKEQHTECQASDRCNMTSFIKIHPQLDTF